MAGGSAGDCSIDFGAGECATGGREKLVYAEYTYIYYMSCTDTSQGAKEEGENCWDFCE